MTPRKKEWVARMRVLSRNASLRIQRPPFLQPHVTAAAPGAAMRQWHGRLVHDIGKSGQPRQHPCQAHNRWLVFNAINLQAIAKGKAAAPDVPAVGSLARTHHRLGFGMTRSTLANCADGKHTQSALRTICRHRRPPRRRRSTSAPASPTSAPPTSRLPMPSATRRGQGDGS